MRRTNSRIRSVSPKRQKQMDEYRVVRLEFLMSHKVCQVEACNNKATDIHHMRGRTGERLLDKSDFLAVCRSCHTYIEEHPAWAKAKGYSRSRLEI